MSRAMGLLLREWREEKAWSREQLVDQINANYPTLLEQSKSGYQALSEKTIQRVESGKNSPTIRTLSMWLGALHEISEEHLDTFLSEMLSAVFSGERPSSEEQFDSIDMDEAEWDNNRWQNALSFVRMLHDVPDAVIDLFNKEHPRKKVIDLVAVQKALSLRKQKHKDTILFVDDEPHMLSTLREFFRDSYQVETALDGMEALALLQDASKSKDIGVIVSDQRMPRMTGVEFLRCSKEYVPHAQRIVMTAYTDIDAIIGSINEAHVYKFFHKPFDFNELQVVVDEAMQRFHLERRNHSLRQEVQTLRDERTGRVTSADDSIHVQAKHVTGGVEISLQTSQGLEPAVQVLAPLPVTSMKQPVDSMLSTDVVTYLCDHCFASSDEAWLVQEEMTSSSKLRLKLPFRRTQEDKP
ncbi:MAG: response regulator [Deltaproteobacteria bacterium]|nr:MAG: response regulator [Deltaproteobacteria bacterium]